MKCSFCGNELEAGSNFCPKCGTILSIEENNEAVDNTYDEPIDIYSNSKPEEEQYEAPEYVSPVLEDEPIYNKPLESEDDDDDPFKEMHPENYEESAENSYYEDEDDYDYDGDDMLVKGSKSKKGVAVISVLVIILVAVAVGGVYAVKNNISLPFISNTKNVNAPVSDNTSDPADWSYSEPTQEDPTEDDLTDEDTTDEDTTDKDPTDKDTTEDDTTEEKTTDKKPTKPSTTEKESENNVSNSKPSQTTKPTTAPTTTAPTTTPTTAPTTAPSTTQPTTTAPTTHAPTAPATTARPTAPQTTAAANQLKKPSKTISKFTVYAKEDGISLRYTPSSSSARILYLSVGADLVVSGEENGFYYVYCSRYSVYGWVSKSYTSSKRPTAQTEQKVSGVVAPDAKGSGKTMYVNTTDGLRLRKGPGTNYDVIRMISNGYPVVVKGTSSSVSGWVYVTDTTHGVSGWVSSAFLK